MVASHIPFCGSQAASFSYEVPQDRVGGETFFVCSVPAKVTKPDGSERELYIDVLFLKNSGSGPAWIPVRFINTVVNPSQAVLH
jgi:hypothetical protein